MRVMRKNFIAIPTHSFEHPSDCAIASAANYFKVRNIFEHREALKEAFYDFLSLCYYVPLINNRSDVPSSGPLLLKS